MVYQWLGLLCNTISHINRPHNVKKNIPGAAGEEAAVTPDPQLKRLYAFCQTKGASWIWSSMKLLDVGLGAFEQTATKKPGSVHLHKTKNITFRKYHRRDVSPGDVVPVGSLKSHPTCSIYEPVDWTNKDSTMNQRHVHNSPRQGTGAQSNLLAWWPLWETCHCHGVYGVPMFTRSNVLNR